MSIKASNIGWTSLPRDPAGRAQKITEMMQAEILSIEEYKRLLDCPNVEQTEKVIGYNCTCGAELIGHPGHSHWCEKGKYE